MVISETMKENHPKTKPLETPTPSAGANLHIDGCGGELFDDCPLFSRRFQFVAKFAAGGVGIIYKAKDRVFNRMVAAKTLNNQLKDDPDANQSFLEEVRLNAVLDHPSIVPVYALGHTEDGRLQCIMKLINGTSLHQFIEEIRRRYDNKKVSFVQEHLALISRLEYFLKICEAVEYCHSLKIVHGDIKPANILMGKFGEVYLMDWGCARPFGDHPTRISGTPNYLPPEFFENKTVTPLIDIFALGIILFELVTLRRGYQDEKDLTENGCMLFEPDKYSHYQPMLKINSRIKAIILKAIHPDPEKRYQKVSELATDIRHFIYDEEISAAPDNILRKIFRILYRNRVKTVIAMSIIFLLFCSGFFYLYYRANEAEQAQAQETMCRISMVNFTDSLASAIEKRFLLAQAQLLLFADNLLELSGQHMPCSSTFYDNEDYMNPATCPPYMIQTSLYENPINLVYMVRTPSEQMYKNPTPKVEDPKTFVYTCNKILCYDLSSHEIHPEREIHQRLLSNETPIHRLFVRWADNSRYSYPGSRSSVNNKIEYELWNEDYYLDKVIFWSSPY